MKYWILFLILLHKLLQNCHHVWNARSVLAERSQGHVHCFCAQHPGSLDLMSIPQGPPYTAVTTKYYSEFISFSWANMLLLSCYCRDKIRVRYDNRVTQVKGNKESLK